MLNSDFVNVCQWFIDNKIKIHFAEEDTKVIILGLEDKLTIHNTIHNPNGLKLLTRFRLGLSHLKEHKFNHNFKDCVNLLCSCILEVESVAHFFLDCHYFTDIRKTLFHELQSVDKNIFNQSDNEKGEILLYGSSKFKLKQNCRILRSSINVIIKSERFNGSIVQ